jgi:dTDP-4-dehydrorhamnose reductase
MGQPRCLIIGASGQLGRQLVQSFGPGYDLVTSANAHAEAGQLRIDLSDPEKTCQTIQSVAPQLILLTGAYCNVDQAEIEQELSHQINAGTPEAIARQAKETGTFLVYFSSDYLYDGQQEVYTELDPPSALNFYGQTKAAGEAAVRKQLPQQHLILRTAWLYGPDPVRKNFILRLVDQLLAKSPAVIPADQFGAPTYTEDLAAATKFLFEKGATGTFNATGPDLKGRMELARLVCQTFDLDEGLLQPKETGQLNQRAIRPLRVALNCNPLRLAGGPAFRNLQAGLQLLKEWNGACHA